MDYNKFQEEVCKKRQKGHFRIRNSWGIYDAYKLIRKNKWYDIGRPLKEGEFYKIVREVNKLYAEAIARGEVMLFPCRMGRLELRKFKKGASFVNGKLRITYPINWSETLKLWYEDEEARRNKTLLRNEQEYVYGVRYDKYVAEYENMIFYQFTLNRFIKRALRDNIQQGKIEALW